VEKHCPDSRGAQVRPFFFLGLYTLIDHSSDSVHTLDISAMVRLRSNVQEITKKLQEYESNTRAKVRIATIVKVGFLRSMRKPDCNILNESPHILSLSAKVG